MHEQQELVVTCKADIPDCSVIDLRGGIVIILDAESLTRTDKAG